MVGSPSTIALRPIQIGVATNQPMVPRQANHWTVSRSNLPARNSQQGRLTAQNEISEIICVAVRIVIPGNPNNASVVVDEVTSPSRLLISHESASMVGRSTKLPLRQVQCKVVPCKFGGGPPSYVVGLCTNLLSNKYSAPQANQQGMTA